MKVSERDFESLVMQVARLNGFLAYHTHDPRRSEPGFPDCVFVGHGRLVFAELKRQDGVMSPPQREWLRKLAEVEGVEVFCWRPSDVDDIERTLSRSYIPARVGTDV